MKLKRCVAQLFAATFLVLEGCSAYDYCPIDAELNFASAFRALREGLG